MKVVLALAVLAFLAVGAYGTAQLNGLFGTTNQVTLTSSSKNTAGGWAMNGVTSDSTYAGDLSGGALHFTFNLTYTGNLPADSSGNPSAWVTFSQAPYGTGLTVGGCSTAFTGYPVSGFSALMIGGHLYYKAQVSPIFTTNAASVTATITAVYPTTQTVATGTFTFAVTNAYVPPATPAGGSPAIAVWSTPATATTTTIGTQVNITGAVPGIYSVVAYYVATTGNQGVAWVTGSSITVDVGATTGSTTPNNWSDLTAYIGSWCGDIFSGSSMGASVGYTANVVLSLRSVTIVAPVVAGSARSYFNGGAAAFAGSNSVTVTDGDADKTPPTCTSALFATPLDVATADTPIPNKVLTLICTDETALLTAGAFVRAVAAGITYDYAADDGTTNLTPEVYIPLHYDGTISVLGVWAMDTNGNAVVYGSCLADTAQTICGGSGGGSSSSAVVASISLVIALILAVLAL